MRMLIEMALILFMPFILYGVWGFFAVRRKKRLTIWDRAPFKTLGFLGLVGVFSLVIWNGTYGKSKPYAKYHPAEMVDGKLVPGYFEDVPPSEKEKK